MNEEEIIKRAQTGDDNAIEELLARYKDLVTKISRSYFLIGGDTEDIIQEGMIGLYRAIVHYDSNKDASFKTFAILCIKRQIVNAIKHASTLKNKALSSAISIGELGEVKNDEGTILVLPSKELSPSDELISKENLKEMQEIIVKSLSRMELIVLSQYLQGYSYDQIASSINKNTKSVDNALSRIKNKLLVLKELA